VRRVLILPTALLVLATGRSGSEEDTSTESVASTPVLRHLDCGSTVAGSERALRQFVAILRSGDEARIRAVLADQGRFFAISVLGSEHSSPHLSVRGDPDEAAATFAQGGRLPLRLTRITNSEPPRRTTDFGFTGRFSGNREVIGKAAIDCTQGNVIVFGAGVDRN
jgi:hypothetical protein